MLLGVVIGNVKFSGVIRGVIGMSVGVLLGVLV